MFSRVVFYLFIFLIIPAVLSAAVLAYVNLTAGLLWLRTLIIIILL